MGGGDVSCVIELIKLFVLNFRYVFEDLSNNDSIILLVRKFIFNVVNDKFSWFVFRLQYRIRKRAFV